MTYSLKLEVDGYELATLVQLAQMRVAGFLTKLAEAPHAGALPLWKRAEAALDLLAAFAHELPLGQDEQQTLKLALTQNALDELVDILEQGVARHQDENTLYVHNMRNLLDDVTTYRGAVGAVRKMHAEEQR